MASSSKIKSFFVPILLVLTALVVSCTVPGTPQPGPEPASPGTSFVGGSNGLLISFIPGLPPDQIVDASGDPTTTGSSAAAQAESQGNFIVGVQVENAGEDDIVQGHGRDGDSRPDYLVVTVEGINPLAFSRNPSILAAFTKELPKGFVIRGKEKVADTVFPGDRARILFPCDPVIDPSACTEFLNYLGKLPGTQRFTIQANACTIYETISAARICLTDEIFRRASPGQTKVCEGTGSKPVENWGAPVKITRLEQTPIKQGVGGSQIISVVFDVEQTGIGQIYDSNLQIGSNLFPTCSSIPIGRENIVDIQLAQTEGSFSTFRCFPQEIRLVNGKGTVTCDVFLNPGFARIDAEDNLVIRLRYGHMVSAQTSLTIHPDRSQLINREFLREGGSTVGIGV